MKSIHTNKTQAKTNKKPHTTVSNKLAHQEKAKILGQLYKPTCRVLILIGIATLLLACTSIWQHYSLTRRTMQTDGKVTRVSKVSGVGKNEKGQDNQKCQINYEITVDGRTYTDAMGYHGTPTIEKCQLSAGQIIKVEYDKHRPSNSSYHDDTVTSRHRTLSDVLQSAIGTAVVGIIPIIIGVLGLKVAKRDIDPDEISDDIITKVENSQKAEKQ